MYSMLFCFVMKFYKTFHTSCKLLLNCDYGRVKVS